MKNLLRTDPTRPSVLLRLEGAALLLLAIFLYRELSASWWLFALVFFVPDVSIAAYAAGPRVGGIVYNVAHTVVLPAFLFGAGYVLERRTAMALAIIWAAHLGFDRALGFGLKYATGFRDTHLQKV